jgi:type IV pilus assembly protein PilM
MSEIYGNNGAFGLDISDDSIKLAKLAKRGNALYLATGGKKDILPGIVSEGEIKRTADMSGAIKELLSSLNGAKLNTKNVVIALPEEETFLRVIKLPKMGTEEARKAAIFEAENHIPMPLRDVYIDCEIFQDIQGKFTEALIVSTPKNIVDDYASAVEGAGLTPVIMETENQAAARALVGSATSNETILIIDIGNTRTNFSIFNNGNLRFGGTISESLFKMQRAISQDLGVDLPSAAQLRDKYGLLKDNDEAQRVSLALDPIMENLAKQIHKYTDFYFEKSEQFSESGMGKRMIICGEGAILRGVEGFLASKLSMPVGIGNPWINIVSEKHKQIPAIDYSHSVALATVLGLAIRGINLDKEKI